VFFRLRRRQPGLCDSRIGTGQGVRSTDWTVMLSRSILPSMASFIALVRAVNVRGTGTLPMAVLTSFCVEGGFGSFRTYIKSGNVSLQAGSGNRVFAEDRLEKRLGKPVPVAIRTAAVMATVRDGKPCRTLHGPNRRDMREWDSTKRPDGASGGA
jgi:hypothetical protein